MTQTVEKSWADEWFERGLERGTLLTRRADLLALLEHSFGPLPESVIQQIDQADDAERLRANILQVLQLKSLDELQL